jgi:hypothetical protein
VLEECAEMQRHFGNGRCEKLGLRHGW